MNNIELKPPEKMWFSKNGPDNDCVISSRVRLSRNLADHLFAPKILEEELSETEGKIEAAVETAKNGAGELNSVALGDLTPLQRRILMERNIIPQELTLEKKRKLLLGPEKNVYGVVNHIDHLRLSGFRSGLDLHGAYNDVVDLEAELEKKLDFAVSLDLGYLSTDVTNLGTGMMASTMLHVPALAEAGMVEKTVRAIVQIGMGVKGFWGEDDHSLGDMYQIANTVAFGSSEKELLEKLENITVQIVHYERKVREELADKKRIELEDKIYRAYGVLTHCRSISSKEAIELLLLVRLGVVLGWINLSLPEVTKMLFLCQTAHIQLNLEEENIEINAQAVDYYRADLIRAVITENKEDLHV